jgi:hypothetical protein
MWQRTRKSLLKHTNNSKECYYEYELLRIKLTLPKRNTLFHCKQNELKLAVSPTLLNKIINIPLLEKYTEVSCLEKTLHY